MQDYPVKACDLLIIGGGGAGALAALEASKHKDLKIILASKGPVGQSGLTPTANGGTAFHRDADDMLRDMVTGGCFLNDQRLVWLMCTEIGKTLEAVKGFGITPIPIRDISVCVPAVELLNSVKKRILLAPGVELMEDVLITRLMASDGIVSGATALNLRTGAFFGIQAKAVIIATGGLTGELYPYTSNNPFGISTDSSGTGHAMAYLAGAELMDMEMIAFVPLPGQPRSLNVRYYPDFWEGPYLNRHGEIVESNVGVYQGKSYSHLFVQKLFREIAKGNAPIYIDQRRIEKQAPPAKISSWRRRRKFIETLGIDPRENKIEIVIGSHFGMGGVRVGESTESTIAGLFAAGEVMAGVHGGLRMPGYSFTQMLVFGFESGRQAARYALEQAKARPLPKSETDLEREKVFGFLETKAEPVALGELKARLQKTMQDHVFVFRDRAGLEKAAGEIGVIRDQVSSLAVSGVRRFNLAWARAIEFSLMVEVAEVIVRSALAREESRGFHFRTDFPQQDDRGWLRHTLARRQPEGVGIDTSPVDLFKIRPEA